MGNADLQPPRRLRWFILVDSKVYGPFDKATIAEMVERNQMRDDDKVHLEGGSSWILAKQDSHLASLFQDSLAPPIRKKGRPRGRWIVTVSNIAILVIVLWMAWPYYAVVSLMSAVREGDVSTLERRVDWNSVRQALRGDINAYILKSMGDKGTSNDAMTRGFAALLGPAVINNMVDGYVTPQGVAAMVRNEKLDNSTGGVPAANNIDRIRKIDWDKVTYAFFAGGPFSFRVDVLPDQDKKRPVGLDLAWNGDWRLVRIVLPPDFLDTPPRMGAKRDTPSQPPQKTNIERPPIELLLLSKKFREANYKVSPAVVNAIEFELSIVNKSQKPLRAFDGVLTFTDLLDNELLSTKLAINQPLPISDGPGVLWSGELEYNQFMDSHKRLRNAELQNIKIKFVPRKLLFADGSTKEFDQ